MEKYTFGSGESVSVPMKLGDYYTLVHGKHIDAYGDVGADNIVQNIVETYKSIQLQLADPNKNNNVLLVGKVQSGKTSNLEMLTALAFDNGYNILVIYGGYDTSLLKLSDCSGFFMSQKHLVYMAYNNEGAEHQNLATEFLRLNTNIEITAIENNPQFESGKYNVIEILPVDGVYDDASLDSFINLCVAHTQFMGASGFVKFFYSLVNLFQFPREQRFVNLVGLFGELSFLKYVSQVMNKDFSDRWHKTGSTDKYDIALDSCNLEIKTTMSVEELVTIKHSQLFNMDRNFLVAVLVEESNGGKTLNQLIAEMQSHAKHFKSFNFSLNIEKEKKRISPVDAETRKFSFKSIKIYDASKINPFLNIPENVLDVSYRLDLTNVPSVSVRDLQGEMI